jgi:hypothetical protein
MYLLSPTRKLSMRKWKIERWLFGSTVGLVLGVFAAGLLDAQDKAADAKVADGKAAALADGQKAAPDANGLVKISKKHPVWLDTKRKAVVMDGEVCLREGQLEMFACPKGTKEHESIIAIDCLPEEVHAGLLAVGAKPGTPVKFDPEYVPATGQVVDVFLLWKDADGTTKQGKAQDWIKHMKTGKPMESDFVFSGSGFWADEETGKRHYQANGGDFICVSNFPTAMLDLPVKSSQANADLLFHANTEKIPPKGTKVRVVLVPRAERKGPNAEKPDELKKSEKASDKSGS